MNELLEGINSVAGLIALGIGILFAYLHAVKRGDFADFERSLFQRLDKKFWQRPEFELDYPTPRREHLAHVANCETRFQALADKQRDLHIRVHKTEDDVLDLQNADKRIDIQKADRKELNFEVNRLDKTKLDVSDFDDEMKRRDGK